jgi:prepilin peptidase CpaA
MHIDTNSFCAICVGSAACVTDLRSRRIPNVLTFGAAAGAVVFHTVAPGGEGFLSATAGWLVGVAVMFLPFALGGLGGGDVKLLGALGAWLGPANALWLGLYAGMAGGAMAVVVALCTGYARQAFTNVWFLLQHWTVVGLRPLSEISLEGSGGPRLAYALPIFVGMLVAIWLR